MAQRSIQFEQARIAYQAEPNDSPIKKMLEDFLNLFSQIYERCLPRDQREGVIPVDYISHLSKIISDANEKQIEAALRSTTDQSSVSWKIFYFIKRCKVATNYEFYIQADYYEPEDIDSCELISRNESYADYLVRKRFGQSRVILATATSGDAETHASSCTLRNYANRQLTVTPASGASYTDIEQWFKKLDIFVVDDIGDTRFPEPFQEAMRLTTNVLKERDERTLVLFKNYRDQKRANKMLSKVFTQDKLFFFDYSLEDSDRAEELASTSQVSLASASSTLWEGINIKDLRLALIISPPFSRPRVGKKFNYPLDERRMLNRLQQGIGRIIRGKGDYGVAVLMDVRFKKAVHQRVFSTRLRDQVKTIHWSEAVPKIAESFSRWSRN